MKTKNLKKEKTIDLLSQAADLLHLAYIEMQELHDTNEIPLDNINAPDIAEVWNSCNDKISWIEDFIYQGKKTN